MGIINTVDNIVDEMAKTPAAQRAASARWHTKHPEYKKEWYERNRERLKVQKAKYRQENREHLRAYDVERKRLKRLGVSQIQYDAMSLAQDGVCKICRNPETARTWQGTSNTLSIDHDHISGKIRDLLCTRCNKVLGQVKESITILHDMILYLEKHRGS